MEMTAVKTSVRLGLGACVAALALALNFGVASAQTQKAPAGEAKKAAPAAPKTTPAKKAAKAKSACAGIDESACGDNSACQWVKASKTKAGKEIKAYCRTKPKATKAKAPAPAKAPAKAPAAAPKN